MTFVDGGSLLVTDASMIRGVSTLGAKRGPVLFQSKHGVTLRGSGTHISIVAGGDKDSLKRKSYDYRWKLWEVAMGEIKKSPERTLFGIGQIRCQHIAAFAQADLAQQLVGALVRIPQIGQELREGRMHRTGAGIEFGVVPARCLVDAETARLFVRTCRQSTTPGQRPLFSSARTTKAQSSTLHGSSPCCGSSA